MGDFLKAFRKMRGRRDDPAQFPVIATGQHWRRFGLALLATLLLGATFDWNEDALWELRSEEQVLYRLNESMADLGAPPGDQEMFVLDKIGLLVRQRNQRAVNLTVLKGNWEVLRDGKVVGRIGQSLTDWQKEVGEPLAVYVHAQKAGVIYYYRASLLDLGLMVANGQILSAMFVEPGYLRSALERSGYTPKQ